MNQNLNSDEIDVQEQYHAILTCTRHIDSIKEYYLHHATKNYPIPEARACMSLYFLVPILDEQQIFRQFAYFQVKQELKLSLEPQPRVQVDNDETMVWMFPRVDSASVALKLLAQTPQDEQSNLFTSLNLANSFKFNANVKLWQLRSEPVKKIPLGKFIESFQQEYFKDFLNFFLHSGYLLQGENKSDYFFDLTPEDSQAIKDNMNKHISMIINYLEGRELTTLHSHLGERLLQQNYLDVMMNSCKGHEQARLQTALPMNNGVMKKHKL